MKIKGIRIIDILPLFFLLLLSGNPVFSSGKYPKEILVIYSVFFIIYALSLIKWKLKKPVIDSIFQILIFIAVLVIFQRIILGFVSYPGVFALILKILLGLFTFLYYKKKNIDFANTYIKLLAILSAISIPFFLINQFGYYGIKINEGLTKTFILYTSTQKSIYDMSPFVRNSGMFWEPGAFAGYLNLALLFVALKNRGFKIGNYSKEIIWITVGLITTMSTAGYLVFSLILIIYVLQNYRWGKFVLLPIVVLILFFAFSKFKFLGKKIESQFTQAVEMSGGKVSNTRFGSLVMDWQYIKARPLIGNGLSARTRYRFNPSVVLKEGNIGNGNGMSNFIAYWGIPFFLFWIFGFYKFSYKVSGSKKISLIVVLIVFLILQGEQFLNFPLFLAFFSIPYMIRVSRKQKLNLSYSKNTL